MTDEHDQWKALEIHQPDQVPAATPLSWQAAKHSEHAERLMNNLLPADFPYEVERGTADDALAVLALRESIRRDIEHGTGNRIHEALKLGATWGQVAAALDVDPGRARELLRAYADGQRRLWLRYEEKGITPLGFNADQHTAALALCELDDEGAPAPDVAPVEEQHQDDTEPVKESTRRYAEELRANPGKASADGHTGWECQAGASLIVGADTPGPGRLGTHHGAIYSCAGHRAAAVERVTGAGYEADPRPAPAGHRWSPWPCGHVTAYEAAFLAAISGQEAGPVFEVEQSGADSAGWDPDDPYGDVDAYERDQA